MAKVGIRIETWNSNLESYLSHIHNNSDLKILYWKGFYGCSFPEAKASGKLAFGQLPILDIDGEHQIAQSGAQNRYVASLVKKPGFNPSAPAKVAFCDMIHETHQGVFYLHLLEFMFVCQFYFKIANLA